MIVDIRNGGIRFLDMPVDQLVGKVNLAMSLFGGPVSVMVRGNVRRASDGFLVPLGQYYELVVDHTMGIRPSYLLVDSDEKYPVLASTDVWDEIVLGIA